MSTTQTVITSLIGILTIAGAYAAARMQRPKIAAEASNLVGKTYTDLINELRSEIGANRNKIDALTTELSYEKQRNRELESWAKALALQLIEEGIEPVRYSVFKGV